MAALLFTRCMGAIYFFAFSSLLVQVKGLIGEKGILPVADLLRAAGDYWGAGAFWHMPTLCWAAHADGFLIFLCAAGMAAALCLAAGFLPAVCALVSWVLYLSLTVAGQDFLGFQWDNLLLEAGFLLVLLYPPLTVRAEGAAASPITVWLMRWLLFRIMFASGMVKILSHDPAWANLTALDYHYFTQPLPNIVSWYAAQMPLWFQKVSCGMMFLAELGLPFLIFCGRRARRAAFFGLAGLQVLIFLTGNYCFFNLLVIALCILLLDDGQVRTFLPFLPGGSSAKSQPWHTAVTGIAGAVIVVISLCGLLRQMTPLALPPLLRPVVAAAAPFRSINTYGLFAVMTTTRDEIIIEGSEDGHVWLTYEFPWKPGNVGRAPGWAAPHQPRLDWQMWFASLGTVQQNPWFLNLMQRLLEGSPSVGALFKENPFRGKPPKFMRASFYEYHFTDTKTRRKIGTWWRREYKGLYCPVVTLPQ